MVTLAVGVVLGLVGAGIGLRATPALAYDRAPDQAALTVLGERIDGDVNQGLLPDDRAALMRAEVNVTQKLITAGDSQATAMLADIDRDLSAYDNSIDVNEADRDLFFHTGDTITIALRDGVGWKVETIQNTDVLDLKSKNELNPPGVVGVYLAKQPGFTRVVLVDPASNRHVRFRIYVVEKSSS